MDTNWKYCTLPTANRLWELGLPQGMTDMSWSLVTQDVLEIDIYETGELEGFLADEDFVSAPDLSEAMRVLEGKVRIFIGPDGDGYFTTPFHEHSETYGNGSVTMTEAACRMIVWLAEHGLINLKEVRL